MSGNEMNSVSTSGEAPVWTPPELDRVAWMFPQFAILGMLGRGSIAAVYHGVDAEGERTAAIKIVGLAISTAPGIARLFAKTMPVVAQLAHAHIVRVHEYGLTAQEHLFATMELVEGVTLRERIAARQLTPVQALSMLEQVCDAAHHAHGNGVVHGALHPGNVFIDRHGPVKVADFGLARLVAPAWLNGARSYLAPEVLSGEAADRRSDVFSAGVMLYEALTGELPHAESLPASALAGVHDRIDGVIARAMEPSPEARYRDIGDLMRAIAAVRLLCIAEARTASGPLPVVASAGIDDIPHVTTAVPLPVKVGRSRKSLLIGGGIAAVLLAVAAVIAAMSGSKAPIAPPRPAVAEWPTSATPAPQRQPAPKPRPRPQAVAVEAPAKPAPKPAEGPVPGEWFPLALGPAQTPGAAAIDGAGVHLTRSMKFEKHQAKDVAARVTIRLQESEPKVAQVWIRNGGPARIQLVLDAKPSAFIQTTLGESKFKKFGEVSAPWVLVGDRWVTVEVAAIGEQMYGAVNGRQIPVELKSDVPEAGTIGLYSAGADFKDLAMMVLDGVEPERYPEFVKSALAAKAVATAKPVEPVPLAPAPPAPEPAAPKASPEVEKWLADTEKPFMENYQRDIAGPFGTTAGALRQKYIATIDQQIAATSTAGKLEEALAWRAERQRFFDKGQNVPADDGDNPLAAIKPLRAGFRVQFGKLDRDRAARARLLFQKFDAVLAQNQELLTQRQRLDDAVRIKTRRDELATTWLKPPEIVAAAPPATARAPASAEPPRAALRDTAAWLLANGAEVKIEEGKKWPAVLDARLIPNGKPVFRLKIDAAKFSTPPTADDLRRIVALRNINQFELNTALPPDAYSFLRELAGVNRLILTGDQMTDAMVDHLAALSELRSFEIHNAKNWSGKTLDLLAKLPGLHAIDLDGGGLDNDGAAALAKITALDELSVRRTKITDIGLAHFAKLRNLRRLEVGYATGVTAEGLAALKGLSKLEMLDFLHDGLPDFPAAVRQMMTLFPRMEATRVTGKTLGAAHLGALAGWRSLKRLVIRDSAFAAGGSAALAQLTNLDDLEISYTEFGDADVAHLLGLRNLKKLNLSNTKLTDVTLMKFKEMKGLKELRLNSTGTTAAGVHALSEAMPGCKVVQ